MNYSLGATLFATLAALPSGCKQASPNVELTLTLCTTDSECPNAPCQCGVCAPTCIAPPAAGLAEHCAHAGTHTACFGPASYVNQALCHANSPSVGLCLPRCSVDSDCGVRAECQLGACVPVGTSLFPVPSAPPYSSPSSGNASAPPKSVSTDWWPAGLRSPDWQPTDVPPESVPQIGELALNTLEIVLQTRGCLEVDTGCGLVRIQTATATWWFEGFGQTPVGYSTLGLFQRTRDLTCDAIEVHCSTCGLKAPNCEEIPGFLISPAD